LRVFCLQNVGGLHHIKFNGYRVIACKGGDILLRRPDNTSKPRRIARQGKPKQRAHQERCGPGEASPNFRLERDYSAHYLTGQLPSAGYS